MKTFKDMVFTLDELLKSFMNRIATLEFEANALKTRDEAHEASLVSIAEAVTRCEGFDKGISARCDDLAKRLENIEAKKADTVENKLDEQMRLATILEPLKSSDELERDHPDIGTGFGIGRAEHDNMVREIRRRAKEIGGLE